VWKIPHDAALLGRVAVVFVCALIAFLLLRQALVPAEFGKYGHYRAGALDENRQRPLRYAGQQSCVVCHEPVATLRGQGKHAGVACEACHGPAFRHAEAMGDEKPARPDVTALCRRCHEADAAKPKKFPQVVLAEHRGGEACNACHQPHKPNL
jgi:predicted CXXCH cytochrome family protein